MHRWWNAWSRLALVTLLTLGLVQASTQAWAAKSARKAGQGHQAKAAKAKATTAAATNASRTRPNASRSQRASRVVRGRLVRVSQVHAVPRAPAVQSVGALAGLHAVVDPLELKSGVALVVDQDSNEVLLSKNSSAVLPIASITKLMTAMLVVEAGQPLDEMLVIEQDEVEQTEKSRSRLVPGTTLSRREMLHLALMSSENRAAYALSRHYPGGTAAFVSAMNRRARQLGMSDTRFVEPTGLSAENRSSAMDLTRLVKAASAYPLIRDFSTARETLVNVGQDERQAHFRSTNGLIGNPEWDISLQKTGYIAAAGRCLVMQARLAGRRLIMVLLDSAGSHSRFGDAERIRKWLAAADVSPVAAASNAAAATVAVPAAAAAAAAMAAPQAEAAVVVR